MDQPQLQEKQSLGFMDVCHHLRHCRDQHIGRTPGTFYFETMSTEEGPRTRRKVILEYIENLPETALASTRSSMVAPVVGPAASATLSQHTPRIRAESRESSFPHSSSISRRSSISYQSSASRRSSNSRSSSTMASTTKTTSTETPFQRKVLKRAAMEESPERASLKKVFTMIPAELRDHNARPNVDHPVVGTNIYLSLTFGSNIFAHEKNGLPATECGQKILAISTGKPKDHIHTYNVTIDNDLLIKDFRHYYRALLNTQFDFKDPSIWNCKIIYYMVRDIEDGQLEYSEPLQCRHSQRFFSLLQGPEHNIIYAQVVTVQECASRKGDDDAWKRLAQTLEWVHQDLREP